MVAKCYSGIKDKLKSWNYLENKITSLGGGNKNSHIL